MGAWIGAVGVRSASVGTRWRPRGAQPRGIPRKIGAKKVVRKFLCAVSTQSHPKRWGKKKGCSCATSPPRLAAGAGDRNAETLKDFYVLGP